jgi:hypothetical protein
MFSYEICVASLLKQLYFLWLRTNLLIDTSAPCIAEQQLKRMQTLPSPDGAVSHATALTASPYYSGRLCPNHAQSSPCTRERAGAAVPKEPSIVPPQCMAIAKYVTKPGS